MSDRDVIHTDAAFSPAERDVIGAIAAAMIPASTEFNVPGADDPRILAAILERLARGHGHIRAEIADLVAAPEANRQEKIAELRDASVAVLSTIASAVVQSYYQDERVMTSLGMEPRPPYPEGYEIEPGDLSLLEPVKRRAKFYRRID